MSSGTVSAVVSRCSRRSLRWSTPTSPTSMGVSRSVPRSWCGRSRNCSRARRCYGRPIFPIIARDKSCAHSEAACWLGWRSQSRSRLLPSPMNAMTRGRWNEPSGAAKCCAASIPACRASRFPTTRATGPASTSISAARSQPPSSTIRARRSSFRSTPASASRSCRAEKSTFCRATRPGACRA